MVCLGDTYHMETSQLFCDANQIEWDLFDKLQLSESTCNGVKTKCNHHFIL